MIGKKMNNFNYLEHYKNDSVEFDYFEERNGVTKHDERRLREYIISKVPKNVKTILDVGCGSAWVAKYFLPKNIKVISFDISQVNPTKAIKYFPRKIHFGLTGDVFHLPLKSNSIDCIIASEIIEHVVNPDLFIKELFKILKPGGKLIVTTPYKEKIQYNLCIHCNKKTPANAHIHSFDETKLSSLYNGNDLNSFKWETFGNKVLVYLRTYVILKYFPFQIWKLKDMFANFFVNAPLHIISIYKKK